MVGVAALLVGCLFDVWVWVGREGELIEGEVVVVVREEAMVWWCVGSGSEERERLLVWW